jgi:hypothetical protein
MANVLVDTSVWIAIDSDMRAYAKNKHFDSMVQPLGLRLYEPGYGGRYNPNSNSNSN